MAYDIWTQADLVATVKDTRLDDVPSFFRSFYKQKHFSAHKKIMIEELPADYRYLAPFVLPTVEGKPISYERNQSIKDFEPPYIKLKDPVTLQKAVVPHVDEFLEGRRMTPQDRFDERVVEVNDQHVRAINLRKEWMAAEATIKATVHIAYDKDQGAANPEITLDFGRPGNHYVVKGSAYWDNASTSILGDVELWSQRMLDALNGGEPGIMIVGTSVAPVFRKNTEILNLMSTRDMLGLQGTLFGRASQLIPRGFSRVGVLHTGLEVWCYNDTYSLPNGTAAPFMDPKEILLMAPGFEGIEANGLIYDIDAWRDGGFSAEIYAKMWKTEGDLANIFVGHQAAPVYIPLTPAKTLRAKVLA